MTGRLGNAERPDLRLRPAGADPWFTAPMSGVELLAERLEEAGFAVVSLEAVTGGRICVARVAALRDGGRVFAKTLADAEAEAKTKTDADLFEVEAAGLSALRELGVRVPAVIYVSPCLLVLEALRSRGEGRRTGTRSTRSTGFCDR
jgi:hypothetical protein